LWGGYRSASQEFFSRKPARIDRQAPGISYEPASLGDVRDFVMGPVLAGMCKFESTKDGTLDLADFATMNEAMMVRSENEWRSAEAEKRKR
jgi:hypothetical protein